MLSTLGGVRSGFLVIILLAFSGCEWLFGVRTYRVPTASMEPTIKKGQFIHVRAISNASDTDFKRGDLVAIQGPEPRKSTLARRVVGIPGDRIEIRPEALVVNGRIVEEPYATWTEPALLEVEPNYKVRLRDLFERGPITIPAGSVYVLCDNRLDTPDSRTFGPLSVKNVVGFVLIQE